MTSYEIKTIDFELASPEKVSVMICQLRFKELLFEKKGPLFYVKKNDYLDHFIQEMLSIGKQKSVNLIIFPELSIPDCYIDELVQFSTSNNAIIIAGTHYKKLENNCIISVSNIIIEDKVYEVQKINPSPSELSPLPNGLSSGNCVYIFKNSIIGSFGVTICADFLVNKIKQDLQISQLDMLIIPACQNNSDLYYREMKSAVDASEDGLYIMYSNLFDNEIADGKSALFGYLDESYRNFLVDGNYAQNVPNRNLYCLKDSDRYVILSVDIKHKKPYANRNTYTGPNVLLIESDNPNNSQKYDFMDAVGITGEVFRNIDNYFVKPREYDKMRQDLDDNNLVIIIGDPGIGKTYTAVHLLYDYFQKGYTPKWFFGLIKENRETQKVNLLSYEPQEKEIVYFEDPFGKVKFERKEELIRDFLPLVEKIKLSKSKIIITSRSQVFEVFSKETLDPIQLAQYSKEMSITKPSYSVNDLIKITENYLNNLTDWGSNKTLKNILIKAIKDKKIVTPITIAHLIKTYRTKPTIQELKKSIITHQTTDQTILFSEEIKEISIPNKVLLYCVFYGDKLPIKKLYNIYDNTLSSLSVKMHFDWISVIDVFNQQEGYRIYKYGVKTQFLRLSHPLYEETLAKLAISDISCSTIAIEVFFNLNITYKYRAIKKFIYTFPELASKLSSLISLKENCSIPITFRIKICNSMYQSNNIIYKDLIKDLSPLKELVNEINKGIINPGDLVYLLRLISLRKEEYDRQACKIDWDSLFRINRDNIIYKDLLCDILDYAIKIHPKALEIFCSQISEIDIIRIYFNQNSNTSRISLNRILQQTKYMNVYSKLLSTYGNLRERKYSIKKQLKKVNHSSGIIWVNDGAFTALLRGANLFPVGVVGVDGNFEEGNVVSIKCKNQKHIFIAITLLNSQFIKQFMGQRTLEIQYVTSPLQNTKVSIPTMRLLKRIR